MLIPFIYNPKLPVMDMNYLAGSYDHAVVEQEKKDHDKSIIEERDSIDRWMREYVNGSFIPSAALVVIRDGAVWHRNLVNTSEKRRYSVASFTKTFTALAALQLVERGKMSLDEPVNNYYPAYLENDQLVTRQITLRDLLTHTSGIVNDFSGPGRLYPYQRYPAGSRFYYSNQGYIVVGRIIEHVSGKPLYRYITEQFLEPLGMKDSVAPETMVASGGLQCTIDDLAKYAAMMLNRGSTRFHTFVSEKTFNEIFSKTLDSPPVKFNEYRGISWRVWTIDDRPYSMNHAALWVGSGGWIQLFPSLGVGYVFISDTPDHDSDEFNLFYRGLKGRLLKLTALLSDSDMDPRGFNPGIPLGEELKEFTGVYKNNERNRFIEIGLDKRGGLSVRRIESGEVMDIVPTSRLTFVYIYPGQSEKGLAFDFTWKKDSIVGLGVLDGYYEKISF
ncbi:MAG: hypothetical protein CVV44_01100 [Spirochaetae bacterium HGW-Spirochaetae-1]|jgi:CubicO group peptidase (beta-lactamase class C family)|nr:MAG: hypothetical protein CVV44_01100 [Spirochaetae bacterium HGW-Spirochaetae-1]